MFDYGRTPAEWTLVDDDRHTADASGAGQTIRLATDMALGIEGDWVRARHTLEQGEQLYCSLSWAEGLASPDDVDEANARLAATTRFWRGWLGGRGSPTTAGAIRSSARRWRSRASPTCRPARPWRRSRPRCPRRRAGSATGTTASPGCADSTFTLQALHYLDLDWEADEFMQFVADLEPNDDGALQIMYGIDGRRDLTESPARTSPATTERSPVRIGNGAFDQRQNDVFGAVLDSILLHTRRSERLPRRLWPIVQAQAECATAVWKQPDQGIWEARGKPQHYVSSKLMCWVALDRAAKLAGIARRFEAGGRLARDRR